MTQIARYSYAGLDRLGALRGGDYIDVNHALASAYAAEGMPNAGARADEVLPTDSLAFFRGGETSLRALADAIAHVDSVGEDVARRSGMLVPVDQTKTLIPIPNPPKIICVARNFGKHAAEAGLQVSEIPILFARFAATQVADGDPIVVPAVSEQVDWEGELAVVIGTGGQHITKADAFDHVAGYTIFNDVSVRDYQFRVTQYTGGKNFFASGPVGPTITLVDEGVNPHDARIITRVNGEVMQDASTAEFIFDIPTIIEHISEFIPLEPGDIIPMGTPAGVGFKRNPPVFLRDGDVVDISVEGLGTLTNPVVAEAR